MPAQHEDEAPPCKKMCESVPRPPAMHILGRRYALTATAYKYLNIGISVGAESVIDIVIDDNRSKQLLLPIKTWNALMRQRVDIQRFLQANFYKSSSRHSGTFFSGHVRDVTTAILPVNVTSTSSRRQWSRRFSNV
ncbi:hypothetical protein EAI_00417 [Harpegnathos saltator]|uniref:Uncharacterized protein n=1 Tax=Harpegnathos saltator TaxID=610380 RepID=E2BRW8_HARSA|nr:hypothetical protein EAI_00417 [Harpegnathos saltator]